jgi:hypothetical protein
MEIDTSHTKEPEELGITCIGVGCMLLIALFIFLCLTEGSWEFLGIAAISSLLLTIGASIVVLPVMTMIGFAIGYMHKKGFAQKWVTRKSINIFGGCIILFSICFSLYQSIPSVRLVNIVRQEENLITDVQATGFSSFLASRWLFSFRLPEQQVDFVAAQLELQEQTGIDLKKSLEADQLFSQNAPDTVKQIPESGKSRSFKRYKQLNQSATWVTLVYSPEAQKAWLYLGYQN